MEKIKKMKLKQFLDSYMLLLEIMQEKGLLTHQEVTEVINKSWTNGTCEPQPKKRKNEEDNCCYIR